jgi:zinc transporter 7
MEKSLRVLGGDEGSHSHSHAHSPNDTKATTTGVSLSEEKNEKRSRKSRKANGDGSHVPEARVKPADSPSKLSAYLNLFGDFVHNMYSCTCQSSFYAI